jgi:triosephosphate isomerase
MDRTPLIAGNWKMHKTVAEGLQLAKAMLPDLQALEGMDTLLCPPATALMPMSALLDGTGVALGAQNLYWEPEGAFTGELAPAMIAEFCSHVIIGHSERRAIFGESDQDAQRKVVAALDAGLVPILCVGESLQENEAGRAAEVLTGQLRAALSGLALNKTNALVIAYEPIWAIGTGKAATPEDTNTLLRNVVRPTLAGLFGDEIAQGLRVLYGGSVKPDNAEAFFQQDEIDGALVGGASLKVDSFVGIARAAQG